MRAVQIKDQHHDQSISDRLWNTDKDKNNPSRFLVGMLFVPLVG